GGQFHEVVDDNSGAGRARLDGDLQDQQMVEAIACDDQPAVIRRKPDILGAPGAGKRASDGVTGLEFQLLQHSTTLKRNGQDGIEGCIGPTGEPAVKPLRQCAASLAIRNYG